MSLQSVLCNRVGHFYVLSCTTLYIGADPSQDLLMHASLFKKDDYKDRIGGQNLPYPIHQSMEHQNTLEKFILKYKENQCGFASTRRHETKILSIQGYSRIGPWSATHLLIICRYGAQVTFTVTLERLLEFMSVFGKIK